MAFTLKALARLTHGFQYGILIFSSLAIGLAYAQEPHQHASGGSSTRHRSDDSENGLHFRCHSKSEADKALKHILSLLSDFGWDNRIVRMQKQSDSEFSFHLIVKDHSEETSTLRLKAREDLDIEDEEVSTIRKGKRTKVTISSKKEIIAQMLSNGRATVFEGDSCDFDKLMDQVLTRQSVAKACATAHLSFPDGSKVLNDRFWDDDFTVTKGSNAIEAMADIFQGKFLYEIGCTAACRAMLVHSVLDYYKETPKGKKLMLKIAGNDPLEGASNEIDDASDRVFPPEGKFVTYLKNVPHNNWHTGDWGYIRNIYGPSRPENGGRQGEEGSNFVYAGGGRFCSYYGGLPDVKLESIYKKVHSWWEGNGKSKEEIGERWRNSPKDDPGYGMLSAIREVPKTFSVRIHDSEPVSESLPNLLAQFNRGRRSRSDFDEDRGFDRDDRQIATRNESNEYVGFMSPPPQTREVRMEMEENTPPQNNSGRRVQFIQASMQQVKKPDYTIRGVAYTTQVYDRQGNLRNINLQRHYLAKYNPAENPATVPMPFQQDAELYKSSTGAVFKLPNELIKNVQPGYVLESSIVEEVSEPIVTRVVQQAPVLPTYQAPPTYFATPTNLPATNTTYTLYSVNQQPPIQQPVYQPQYRPPQYSSPPLYNPGPGPYGVNLPPERGVW